VIFVTIGSAFPFDRLIRAMDSWAAETGRGGEMLAQIGRGFYHPVHMDWQRELSETAFAEAVSKARLVVSHAGMGSVITALCSGTPIVILPRRFEAAEHTTDHQMATARWLEDRPGVFVAWDEAGLASRIGDAESWSGGGAMLEPVAPAVFTDRLQAQVREWIAE